MKGRPIDQIIYEHMFPKPKPTDPQNFQGLLQRQLVPEVRLETQAFYGHLSSQEAKYPGLNYSYQPHRNRLSRFTWHRRLFRAFDTLGLTDSEIQGLTKWEGTRWAKERFEREQGIVIRDTTGDGIEDWVEPELRIAVVQPQQADVENMDDIQDEEEEREIEENEGDEDMEEEEEEEEDSDAEIQSVGIELNERLIAAAAQREAGHAAPVMDEEWEQWLKETIEAGGISLSELSPDANIPGTRPATSGTPSVHPRILNAARLGQWHQIPGFLQNLRRSQTSTHPGRTQATTAATSLISSNPSRARASLSETASRRLDRAVINRLDHHFADQFSRRPIPRLPSEVGTTPSSVGVISTIRASRLSHASGASNSS
jgi:hypothetical protein